MKIFLSWSGERSQSLGRALRDWLPLVLQYVDPWLSDKDIAAGDRWPIEVGRELENSSFGILCLTDENLKAPWVLFEAGALSKIVQASAVCPYLLDVDVKDIAGPLSQFQAKKADKVGTLDLLRAINAKSAQPLDLVRLAQVFDGLWPVLEAQLARIPQKNIERQQARPESEILEDLVTAIRELEHRSRNLEERVIEILRFGRFKRQRSGIEICAQGDFRNFKAGEALLYNGEDLIGALQSIIDLAPETFGKEWYLRDDETDHFLTIEEARNATRILRWSR
ncbi:MAG: toll-Interleukin receptor [Acidobacteria bacterium]|nr:MAG: toll-Interleukin receptor [Acidobacteriota bacterium]